MVLIEMRPILAAHKMQFVGMTRMRAVRFSRPTEWVSRRLQGVSAESGLTNHKIRPDRRSDEKALPGNAVFHFGKSFRLLYSNYRCLLSRSAVNFQLRNRSPHHGIKIAHLELFHGLEIAWLICREFIYLCLAFAKRINKTAQFPHASMRQKDYFLTNELRNDGPPILFTATPYLTTRNHFHIRIRQLALLYLA